MNHPCLDRDGICLHCGGKMTPESDTISATGKEIAEAIHLQSRARERYRNDATFHRFVRGLVTMLTTEGSSFDDLVAACALAATIQKDEAHE